MENVHQASQWYELLSKRTGAIRPALLAGIGLVMLLGVVAGLNPLAGIALCVLLLLALIVVPRPTFIVYGLILLLPLTAGMTRGAIIPFLRLGQALLVVGFILFLFAKPGRQSKSRLSAIDYAFVLFFLAGVAFPMLALLYRGDPLDLKTPNRFSGATPLQTLLGPLQYYLLYRVVVATISSEKQIETVLKLSFVASIVISIIGILQKLGVGFVTSFLAAYYPNLNLRAFFIEQQISTKDLRISSTLESFGGLAAYLACILILALTCYIVNDRHRFSPLLLITTLFIDSIALLLTATVAAWIGMAIGAVVVCMILRRLPKSIIFVVGGMALAAPIFSTFLSNRFQAWSQGPDSTGLIPQTVGWRIRFWQDLVLPTIGKHLLFGSGPAPQTSSVWPSAEMQYLDLLLRGGLLYLFSYMLLIGVAIVACWGQIKRKSDGASQIVAIATLAILVAINVMNVSSEYFTAGGVTIILWPLLALVVASGQLQQGASLTALGMDVRGPGMARL
jgi:hypothetical protein